MALHTKQEFAEKCGIKTKDLSVYIRRGKVVLKKGTEMIDDKDPINNAFIQTRKNNSTVNGLVKHLSQYTPPEDREQESAEPAQRVSDIPDITTGIKQRPPQEPASPLLDGVPHIDVSTRLLKFKDAQKRDKENRLLDYKIKRIRGELVPAEILMPIFMQHNKSILSAMKLGFDAMLHEIAHKTGASSEIVAALRTKIVGELNAAMAKAATDTAASVESVIKDYSMQLAEKK